MENYAFTITAARMIKPQSIAAAHAQNLKTLTPNGTFPPAALYSERSILGDFMYSKELRFDDLRPGDGDSVFLFKLTVAPRAPTDNEEKPFFPMFTRTPGAILTRFLNLKPIEDSLLWKGRWL